MKTAPLAAIIIVAGLALGGGASYATMLVLAPPGTKETAKPLEPAAPTFVSTGKIMSPLVTPNGRLAGYVQFEAMLETAPEQAEFVKMRLPVLLNAVNMRTYRTPMTSGPDGMLPNLDVFRGLMLASTVEAFGTGRIKSIAIVQATPA